MILNIIVLVFVLLIGYWWANQGLFSAIIHLLCVIVAGAIALALWEPIGVGLFMKSAWFVSYAMASAWPKKSAPGPCTSNCPKTLRRRMLIRRCFRRIESGDRSPRRRPYSRRWR